MPTQTIKDIDIFGDMDARRAQRNAEIVKDVVELISANPYMSNRRIFTRVGKKYELSYEMIRSIIKKELKTKGL